MKNFILSFLMISTLLCAETTNGIDANDVEVDSAFQNKLPDVLLKSIKSVTDILEIVDEVSYKESLNLHQRHLNPEKNLLIYEEMVRVYTHFCKNRCILKLEQIDVYKLVLIRSMFNDRDTMKRIKLNYISKSDALSILKSYKLKALN